MRNTVPTQFTIGESLAWKKSLADYPASLWTLEYHFRGAGPGFNRTATADGDDHLVAVPASVTANLTAGRYYYQAFASAGDERVLVDSGECMAKPGFGAITADEEFDGRSQVKKILDAIDALIEGKASIDQLEYTIGDRQLRRYSLDEIIKLRDKYAALYAAELRDERKRKGGGALKNYYVRFRRPG